MNTDARSPSSLPLPRQTRARSVADAPFATASGSLALARERVVAGRSVERAASSQAPRTTGSPGRDMRGTAVPRDSFLPRGRLILALVACAALGLVACDDADPRNSDGDATSLDGGGDGDGTGADATRPDATSADTAGDTAVGDTASDVDLADASDVVEPAPDLANTLETPGDFAALADAEGNVKYLANVEGAEVIPPLTEPCTFQNSLRFEYHIQFLRTFDELAELGFDQYTAWVLVPETRVWWGGTLTIYPATADPGSGLDGVMAYTVYAEPNGEAPLGVDDIAEVDARLAACIPWASELLVFLPTDPAQQQATREIETELAAAGVDVVFPSALVTTWSAQALTVGQVTGRLRLVPDSGALPGDLSAGDVVVTDRAPATLPDPAPAGWVFEEAPADDHPVRSSDVPVAVRSGASANQVIAAFDGERVKFTIDGGGLRLEPVP